MDIYATFYNFVVNVSVFVASALGTAFLSWTTAMEEARGGPLTLFGFPFYGSQLLIWIQSAGLLLGALFVWKIIPYMHSGETA